MQIFKDRIIAQIHVSVQFSVSEATVSMTDIFYYSVSLHTSFKDWLLDDSLHETFEIRKIFF